MRTACLLALFTVGCATPWTAVLDGMHTDRILVALNTEDSNYTARAPTGFVPSATDRWVLFYYDAKTSPDVAGAFQRLDDDCYVTVEPAPDGVTREVAACAFERVPPPPPEEQQQP